ncbi:hypothetical protein [Chitinophaga nivalis]|uniref:Lipoprotein n=1 Tax=Chitinophaga nivalis TaxID=2991709 RepID=A0ABT3IUA4_9BACT|nr:hypothetical protein [Chitinophaga nivalis]MCW3462769.1 hypothetical protein [Chitinophaga nivalis]MCW3487541.1 hypothetical protein [Chitinophaga nivalis]
MRITTLLMAAMVAIAGVGLVGCNNKKDEPKPDTYISFKLGNDKYISNETQAYMSDTVIARKKTLVIDGVTNNFKHHMELMVTFPEAPAAGTFDKNIEMSLMHIEKLEPGYTGSNIQVKITSINSKYAEGTFSGKLTSGETEKPLTDGTFKVNIY